MMKALQFKKAWVLAVLLWLGVIAAGYSFLLHYSFAAGKTIAAPAAIPPAMAPQGVSRKAQLFLALHPHCPCSRATLRELAKILTRAPAGAEVTVLMYKPNKQSDRWMEGGLLD